MRIVIIALFLIAPIAHAECPNSEAAVRIDSMHSQDLINTAAMISSMPLEGSVKEYGNATDTVMIRVPDAYAREHREITAFDVAQKVVGFASSYPHFGIHRIEAVVCPAMLSQSIRNIGTIGHGR